MRIREVFLKNIRNFRDERLISFVDPLTGDVRPLTVLAGSNGSGKTTVLQAIESLFHFAISKTPDQLIKEAYAGGLLGMVVELSEKEFLANKGAEAITDDPDKGRIIPIIIGNLQFKKHPWISQSSTIYKFSMFKYQAEPSLVANLEDYQWLIDLKNASEELGGYLFFPHDRQLGKPEPGRIEKPSPQQDWLYHYKTSEGWKDSLEQLWVWQNYLDLEQGVAGKNLKPFVQRIEKALGDERRIFIQEGEVYVHTGWKNADGSPGKVRLDQLPSGEQQVLLLLGEIQRRMRKGAVIAIDEVENSLHPTLQRLLMWNLRQIAKEWDAQVIITTHSPEIIQTVRGGAFINLDYPEARFDRPLDEPGEEAR